MDNYLTFQRFSDKDAASELIEILKQHDIDFVLEDSSASFDPTFADSEAKEYKVKLKKENFEKADKLLLQLASQQIDKVEKDYYLFEFTDEELIEIITKPDEWSKFDYLLAQKLLKDRGKEIKPEVAETIKRQRLQELGKPEEGQRSWILLGYISALLGGLLGIFIGHHLRYHKKTLPNGDRVFAYTVADRDHGFNIFLIGIVFFIIWTVILVIKKYIGASFFF